MTNAQLSPGYIYRVDKANLAQLEAIITTHVRAGSIFGGAAQWDFDAKQGDKNLRAVEPFSAATPVNLSGDFGHAFNADIEVRWKRRDDGDYDVLILSETTQSISDATRLEITQGAQWGTRHYADAAIVQTNNRPSISYIDYLAPNGAVQFQRFVEVK